MNYQFMGSRWFLLLIAIILPLILLVIAMLLHASVCISITLLVWVGTALMIIYMPRHED